jgi:hypothetical protein
MNLRPPTANGKRTAEVCKSEDFNKKANLPKDCSITPTGNLWQRVPSRTLVKDGKKERSHHKRRTKPMLLASSNTRISLGRKRPLKIRSKTKMQMEN